MTACPFCKGRGVVVERISPAALRLPGEDYEHARNCEACAATGDYETARLMRAVALGEARGLALASARLEGANAPDALTWDRVKVAVTDDLRRQRREEMLAGGEREALEATMLERLQRERAGAMAALSSLAAELHDRLVLECPGEVEA